MKKKIMVLLLASLALTACGQKKETEPSASSSQKQVASSAKKSSSSKRAGNSATTSSSTDEMAESQTSASPAENVSQEVSASSTQEEAAAEATSGATIPAIQGTWSSAMGSITIEGDKLTNGAGTFTIKQLGDGSWTLAEVVASPPVYYFVPAGQPLATSVRTYESDETRDRIFIQPQYDAPQEAFEPYIFYPAG